MGTNNIEVADGINVTEKERKRNVCGVTTTIKSFGNE
jgi:hypothetical protein